MGVDEIVGFLQWGWSIGGARFPGGDGPHITVHDLAAWLEQERDVAIIDVREPSEWDDGHIDGAVHLPMFEAVARRAEVPDGRPKAVLCAGGLRSSAVIGALQRHGLEGFHNVTGGMSAWVKAGYGVTRGGSSRRRPSVPGPRSSAQYAPSSGAPWTAWGAAIPRRDDQRFLFAFETGPVDRFRRLRNGRLGADRLGLAHPTDLIAPWLYSGFAPELRRALGGADGSSAQPRVRDPGCRRGRAAKGARGGC